MNINVSPELARFIKTKVDAGYGSPSDVVEGALRLWQTSEQRESITGQTLQRLIAVGQAEADRGELIDGHRVFDEMRQHSAARQGTPR